MIKLVYILRGSFFRFGYFAYVRDFVLERESSTNDVVSNTNSRNFNDGVGVAMGRNNGAIGIEISVLEYTIRYLVADGHRRVRLFFLIWNI